MGSKSKREKRSGIPTQVLLTIARSFRRCCVDIRLASGSWLSWSSSLQLRRGCSWASSEHRLRHPATSGLSSSHPFPEALLDRSHDVLPATPFSKKGHRPSRSSVVKAHALLSRSIARFRTTKGATGIAHERLSLRSSVCCRTVRIIRLLCFPSIP